MQLSLQDLGRSAPNPGFVHLRRIELDAGAWVDVAPGWFAGPTALFDRVKAATSWEQRRRTMYERQLEVPRLLGRCEVGELTPVPLVRGETRARSAPAVSPEQAPGLCRELRQLAALLGRRYGRLLDHITLAYYRDGRDSVAFHGDRLGTLRPDTVVAILALGAPRRFGLRPAAGRHSSMRPLVFHLGEGDLLVMGGSCQATWEHGVPKTRLPVGPRIAVMFREGSPSLD